MSARGAAGRRGRAAMAGAAALMGLAAGSGMAQAQGTADAATVQELRREMEAMRRQLQGFEEMRRRLEQLEAANRTRAPAPAPARTAAAPAPAPSRAATQADVRAAQDAAREARLAASEAQAAQRALAEAPPRPALEASVPGLAPAAVVGNDFEDALRSDLPGIAFRVPGTDTQVRIYGFAKLTAWTDLNGRNQSDAPLPSGIPLRGSGPDRQGGDFGMTARFSRFGVDTRTLTSWGTLETRLEGDFGGGSPTSSNAVFRLRQAWAELGDERLRVLAGQTNSLWNEGLFETLIDATNLNQSFIRQAQLRVTGRLATGLTGQVSIEAPDTQYTSMAGTFTPDSSLNGGASPAFNAMPDFHGRLTYRHDGMELSARGMLRQLQIRPAGTAADTLSGSRTGTGFGMAGHVRLPMRWLSEAFGQDELLGLAYYGEGIGRYFAGSTNGLDALSNIGMPGVQGRVSLDPLPSWGVTAAYRRFWTPQLRSNFSYAYARQDFPDYARGFTPGSGAATALNRDVQQVFANLIWSPFAEVRGGAVAPGWLDVGLEYLFTRRDLFGGAAATGAGQTGHGIANRFLFAAIARF